MDYLHVHTSRWPQGMGDYRDVTTVVKDTGISPPRFQVWTKADRMVLRFPEGVDRPRAEYPTTRKLKWIFTRPFSDKEEIEKRRDNVVEPDQEVAGANFKEKEIKERIFVAQTQGHSMMTAVGEHAAKVLTGKLTDHEQCGRTHKGQEDAWGFLQKYRRNLDREGAGTGWFYVMESAHDRYLNGESQSWSDEMAGTRKHELTWPQMPPLGPLDQKDGDRSRCLAPQIHSARVCRWITWNSLCAWQNDQRNGPRQRTYWEVPLGVVSYSGWTSKTQGHNEALQTSLHVVWTQARDWWIQPVSFRQAHSGRVHADRDHHRKENDQQRWSWQTTKFHCAQVSAPRSFWTCMHGSLTVRLYSWLEHRLELHAL